MAEQQSGLEQGQTRSRIDAGETGDKVPAPDPAMSPMYTDQEAGGTPTPAAVASADTARQVRIARTIDPNVHPVAADSPGTPPAIRSRALWVGIAVVVLVVAGVVAAGMLLPGT